MTYMSLLLFICSRGTDTVIGKATDPLELFVVDDCQDTQLSFCADKLKVCFLLYKGFPQLLETLEKPGIYFGSLNPGNSLELCVKTLNPLEICERHKKIDQHTYLFFLSKFHTVLSSTIFFFKLLIPP